MASSQTLRAAPKGKPDDLLAYLPRSDVREYRKRDLIYGEAQPLSNFYLVVDGKVKISRCTTGKHIVIDIYQADEVFGESSLLGLSCGEEAHALENTRLMSWTREEIEQTISRQPRLAIAFLQVIVQRASTFKQRIESLCTENSQQRLARLLLGLAHRMGTPARWQH